LYSFPHFGKYYREKSGNPASRPKKKMPLSVFLLLYARTEAVLALSSSQSVYLIYGGNYPLPNVEKKPFFLSQLNHPPNCFATAAAALPSS
jgi:hypothetical protein